MGTYRRFSHTAISKLHSFLCQHFWARCLMLATNLSNWPSVIEWFSYRKSILLSYQHKVECYGKIWVIKWPVNYRLSRPTGTFLTFFVCLFFLKSKKTWLFRFFELPHTFSRTLSVTSRPYLTQTETTLIQRRLPVGKQLQKLLSPVDALRLLPSCASNMSRQPTPKQFWCI